MKVAVIHNHPIHYKHLLFQEMKKQQLDFEVLFAAGQSSIRHEENGLSQDLYSHRIGYDGPYELAPASTRIRFTWNALAETRPQIVVIGGYHTPEGWAAWLWARLHGRPTVLWYESNEFDYKRWWYKELPKKLFVRYCDRAQVYGRSHKSYLVKLGIPEPNVILKRSVADVAAFSTTAEARSYADKGVKHIVYVGRLAPEKNVSIVLRALARANKEIREPKLRFTIAGAGPLEEQLKRESEQLGLARAVDFAGYCPQQQLPQLLRAADFLVLPSTREPWGLAALEAMLCRVPVLVSTQCGCAEDVVTSDTGWKFSPWNEAELTSLLSRLPEIPAQRAAEMGEACHRIASEHSAPSCAERVIKSLQELAISRFGALQNERTSCAF